MQSEEIFVATFTEKAAKELITRITNELAALDISVNVNEMYVGTFHSICLRIIKEHLEYSRLKKNYRMRYLIYVSSILMKQDVLDDPGCWQIYFVQGEDGQEYELNIERGHSISWLLK